MRRANRTDKKDALIEMRNILNIFDPENLSPGVPNCAPINEYESEAGQILSFILNNREKIVDNKQILIEKINEIWKEEFGNSSKNVEEIVEHIFVQFLNPKTNQ